jgi:DNA invertase Pin-like site-specific DNA recombinase
MKKMPDKLRVVIYARVSTTQQELQHQIDACRRLCEYKQFEVARVYSEKISSTKVRPVYLELLKDLRAGLYDGVVVFRLDRLGRTSRELSLTVEELETRGIKVLSVNESFDTSTAMCHAMREIIFIFAELERQQIGEATSQRLAALKAAGKKLGQKPLSNFQVNKVRKLAVQGLSCRKIAQQMRISHTTAYNIVNRKGYYSHTVQRARKIAV